MTDEPSDGRGVLALKDLRGVGIASPPMDGLARAARGVVKEDGFSGLIDRRGVALVGDGGGPMLWRLLLASSAAVIPKYLLARDPAVILDATGVGGVGLTVILLKGKKRPHNGSQAKYWVLET